ncbi:YhcN/YlaJ family sporulation lipoprotein [Priestia megaterium]|uniref:YhcN/YlaJ family sporulation lipoprotein n=1 Tax=Priestia megaterium TaxID=1404 RepID=UPI002079D16D|nr:YhcN/YlaJ family sporulation lipoprotein [Priestia megaterium]USL38896.1 YhcN/YlaJ family sporulation lipoprotein [Priestia megaterium]
MKKRKYLLGLLSTILSVGVLFGCNDKKDEAEPDPTEEPSEQRAENARNNNGPRNVGFEPNEENNDKNQTKLEVADEAANRIAKLDEVDSANVIVTNRNAYVAVVLQDGTNGKVTDRLEKKIADQVRATDSDIQEVYVSANPDFVNRMKDYEKRINEGAPVKGLFEEFTVTVQRVFPNAR